MWARHSSPDGKSDPFRQGRNLRPSRYSSAAVSGQAGHPFLSDGKRDPSSRYSSGGAPSSGAVNHNAPSPLCFLYVYALRGVKVLCFDRLVQVFILKGLRTHFTDLRILKDLQGFLLQISAIGGYENLRQKQKSGSMAAALQRLFP
jgi:hypothetical protein